MSVHSSESHDDTSSTREHIGHVVVTGAAGFIGSHLVDELLARGEHVIGIDSFDPWYSPHQKQANLALATRHHRFELATIDLLDPAAIEPFEGANRVFHLAGRPGVQDSWGPGFGDATRQNVEVTQRVYEHALACAVERVVYASSSSVYGNHASPGQDRATTPISPYGVTKLAGEQLAEVYRLRGLSISALRYFTVYGPRQRPDMAMHRIFEATIPDGPTFVRRGDGHQEREFTYVADIVEATIAASHAPLAANAALDIGGGSVASLNDVINEIAKISGVSARVRVVPSPSGDPTQTEADSQTTRRLLGWEPKTPLAEGLRSQWSWHRQRTTSAASASTVAAR
jgi:nucleoside-diphosphate-sugar epimerase